MNITFFINCLYGGGAERVTCNLANYFAEKKYDVTVMCMSENERSYYLADSVKKVFLLKKNERSGRLLNSVRRIVRLIGYLRSQKNMDCYVVMLPKTTLLLLGLSFFTKAKIVASERVAPETYPPRIQHMLKRFAGRADGFVFQTQEACEWYGSSVDGINTDVIPNAINPSFILPHYEGGRSKKIVGIGRLKQQKRFDLLIDAFAGIKDDFPEYTLRIFGEGEKRQELAKKITSLGLNERVELPGNSENIIDEIRDAALFVLSSDYEGMPNALMEAMALGLPCISTDCPCGGPAFLIENGENGLLVPVRDTVSLTEAMRRVLCQKELAEKLGRNAETISERLAPEVIYGKWESLILKTTGFK